MDLIREILASHESGISRDGLLAWARLRGDPQMTDEQLDSALAALGDEVVDVQGFLYLRQHAPSTSVPAAAPTPPPTTPAWGEPPPPAAPPPVADGGWPPSDQAAWGAPPPAPGSAPGDSGEGGWGQPDQPAWAPPAAQPAGSRRSMVIAGAAVGVFVVMALGVSLVLRAGDEPATPAVPTPTSGTVVGAQTLEIGDCLILPTEDTFDDVRTLDCTESHDAEVFFVGDHPDGDFPSDDAFESFVDEVCLPAFAAYTGSDYYEQEVLDVGWFTPTEGAWEGGDREVVCHLTPADGSQSDRSWAGGSP